MRPPIPAALVIAAVVLAATSAAAADPCKAIPDNGPMPPYLRAGAVFSGPVVYVGDGDSLCVATGAGKDRWVEVRVADFYAAELNAPGGRAAKAALERVAMGKSATCRAQKRSHDRVVARCTVQGRNLGDLLRRQGVREGGNGARRPALFPR
jgi:endonuclease YncB( thermonuclease family)